jgi:hypothetical protein
VKPLPTRADADLPAPDIDENGVDRAQIRAMLALTPEERLERVQQFLESALEIRELNDPRRIHRTPLPSAEALARATAIAHRTLTPEEWAQAEAIPLGAEERAEILSLVAWFCRAYARWKRTSALTPSRAG